MLRLSRILLLLLALLIAPPGPAQEAAEPANLPYQTEILPSGDPRLDAAITAVSQLRSLQEVAPTDAAGLLARAEEDKQRLISALNSEGYWAGLAQVTVAGQDPATPGLADRLAGQSGPSGGPVAVRISVEHGPQYRIGQVQARAPDPEGQRAVDAAMATPFGLAPGDPARAEAVLDAERTLLDRLLAAGYPLAKMARREVTVNNANQTMNVVWHFDPGRFARFAPPRVEGAERVNEQFLTRQASPLAGQPYSPAALERQRAALMGLGVFSSVRIRAAEQLTAAGLLPVTFIVAERPRHAMGGTVAYETNYGPSVRAYWEHRNLFGGAERLRLEAEIARIGVGSSGDPSNMTYRIGGTLTDPGVFRRPLLSLQASSFYLRERLEAYDRDAITAAAIFHQQITPRVTLRAGPQLDVGSVGPPGGPTSPYQILSVLLGARWDASNSLLDPSRGWRLDGTLTPSLSIANAAPFLPLRVTGTYYWDVFDNSRSILALRGSFGSMLGIGLSSIPRHIRFYAGGGGSVRGYDYQSIGPRDARNRPSGGASLLEASVEWRQRVYGNFGAVAFVDMGSVGTGSLPDGPLRVGVGLGLRYYTAIGPIRADVALPLVKVPGNSGYGLYLGIGQAF